MGVLYALQPVILVDVWEGARSTGTVIVANESTDASHGSDKEAVAQWFR
jgi:hypothetical protein